VAADPNYRSLRVNDAQSPAVRYALSNVAVLLTAFLTNATKLFPWRTN